MNYSEGTVGELAVGIAENCRKNLKIFENFPKYPKKMP